MRYVLTLALIEIHIYFILSQYSLSFHDIAKLINNTLSNKQVKAFDMKDERNLCGSFEALTKYRLG